VSGYSELIKKFDKTRDYMRDFYVYGFMSREDFDRHKSLRTYDNERRRIESWLSECISFRTDKNGKSVFLSVDSAAISENPFYRAFKAKSFTPNDITLNFFILDILQGDKSCTASEIADIISSEYMPMFEKETAFDVSTVRNKLAEYAGLGLLKTEKQGKKLLYTLNQRDIDIDLLNNALSFFSEISPLGVAGSYLLDKCNRRRFDISFKHHYIMHALESEIVFDLLNAMHLLRSVEISSFNSRQRKEFSLQIIPLKILISVQGGRRYLSAYNPGSRRFMNYRLDYIKSVKQLDKIRKYNELKLCLDEILKHTWGVSFVNAKNTEHLSMTLNILHNERFMVDRIKREGRQGILTQLDKTTYKYEIDVYDASEMLPWLRTFIGRIVTLECDNKSVEKTFLDDFNSLCAMYGGN